MVSYSRVFDRLRLPSTSYWYKIFIYINLKTPTMHSLLQQQNDDAQSMCKKEICRFGSRYMYGVSSSGGLTSTLEKAQCPIPRLMSVTPHCTGFKYPSSGSFSLGWHAPEIAAEQVPVTGIVDLNRRNDMLNKNAIMAKPTIISAAFPGGEKPVVVKSYCGVRTYAPMLCPRRGSWP